MKEGGRKREGGRERGRDLASKETHQRESPPSLFSPERDGPPSSLRVCPGVSHSQPEAGLAFLGGSSSQALPS